MEANFPSWQVELLAAHQRHLVTLLDYERQLVTFLEGSAVVHAISRYLYQHVVCEFLDTMRWLNNEDLSGTYLSRTESVYDSIGMLSEFQDFMKAEDTRYGVKHHRVVQAGENDSEASGEPGTSFDNPIHIDPPSYKSDIPEGDLWIVNQLNAWLYIFNMYFASFWLFFKA